MDRGAGCKGVKGLGGDSIEIPKAFSETVKK